MRVWVPGSVRIMSACAVALLSSGAGHALELGIAPLRVELEATQASGSLTVTNQGHEKVAMQVDAQSWIQDADGQNLLQQTDVVLAVPPLFELEPGESQLVRVGVMQPERADQEQAFRLLLTELAPPVANGTGPGLRLRTRISVPVFVRPARPVRSRLQLQSLRIDGGEARIRLHNAGSSHARLERLELLDRTRQLTDVGRDLATYVLPGATQEIRLQMPLQQSVGYVRVRTSQAEMLDLPAIIQEVAEPYAQHAPGNPAELLADR
jgi:fimbrial chaperone protein